MYFTTSAPNFLWGGAVFNFSKNRPQKHQKRAILHTSQANGGVRAPPPPPPATLLQVLESCNSTAQPRQQEINAKK